MLFIDKLCAHKTAFLGLTVLAASTGVMAQTVGVAVPLGPQADVGVISQNGAGGLAAGVTFGDVFRVRLAGDVTEEARHALAAVGLGFDRGYVLIGASHAREALAGYADKDLSGEGLFAEVALVNPVPGILRAYLNARREQAGSQHLSTTVVESTQVQVQELLQVFRSASATRYRTTQRTVTTVTTTTTRTDFMGGARNTLSFGVDTKLGENTRGTLALSHQRTAVPGVADASRTQGSASLTQYFPSARTQATLGVGSKGRVALAGQWGFSGPWSLQGRAYADTRGDDRQRGVFLGLGYQWGGGYNPGQAPDDVATQLDDRLRRMTASSDGVRALGQLGRIAQTRTEVVHQFSQDRVSERTKARGNQTTAPETPAEPVNTPLNLGSITCNRTTVVGFQSFECSITPVDPDGIEEIYVEFDGVRENYPVTGSTFAYSRGELFPGDHTLQFFGRGKKPDGSIEDQQFTAPVTITASGFGL